MSLQTTPNDSIVCKFFVTVRPFHTFIYVSYIHISYVIHVSYINISYVTVYKEYNRQWEMWQLCMHL